MADFVSPNDFAGINERAQQNADIQAAKDFAAIKNAAIITAATPEKTLVFPQDLRNPQQAVSGKIPFMMFYVIKYRDRWSLSEDPNKSASISATLPQQQLLQTICLPLPQDVQNNIAPNWAMEDSKITQALMAPGGLFSANPEVIKGVGGLLGSGAALFFREEGKKLLQFAVNPRKQAFFGGIEPRQFTFTWIFSPQSKEEAQTVEDIVAAFTKWSLPSILHANEGFFQFPAEYKIDLLNVKGFPKFPESLVCIGVQTHYSANGVQLLDDDHPVQTGLQLTFLETTVRTNDPGNTGV